jgi:hypothetical protein
VCGRGKDSKTKPKPKPKTKNQKQKNKKTKTNKAQQFKNIIKTVWWCLVCMARLCGSGEGQL